MPTTDASPGCETVLESLEELLDGELSVDREREVRSHLDGCSGCATELQYATTLQQELRALPELDAPSQVIDRVLTTARRQEQTLTGGALETLGRAFGRLLPKPARWAMASLAAVALAVLVLVPRGAEVGTDPTADPELARAILEARFALAIVGNAGRDTGLEIRNEVLRGRLVVPTVRGLLGPSGTTSPSSGAQPDETGGAAVEAPTEFTDTRPTGPRRS